MGQLTAQQLENAANAAQDFHDKKGKVFSQVIQDKPLAAALKAGQETFPGGKEFIDVKVKGVYDTSFQGFSGDDTVTYGNPANIKKAYWPWKELHGGIKVTLTELKIDGITINDTAVGKGENYHSDRDATMLANMFKDKLEDMDEGLARSFQSISWQDGTQDASVFPGIRSFIVNDPTTATIVGGLDQSLNTWWRNRASLALSTADAATQVVVAKLQKEMRQLRRYGNPKHKMLAGSDFMEWFEKELRAKGNYTLEGWSKGPNGGRIDASVADLAFKGVAIDYDPSLDDLGLAKYLYVLDMNAIKLKVMEGEDMKMHSPARPADKYVLYRAKTWTGGLTCRQRNTSGVYSIA